MSESKRISPGIARLALLVASLSAATAGGRAQSTTVLRITAGGQTRDVTLSHQPPAGFTTDSDGNGMGDAWERRYFGNLGVDPQGDPDGDGLVNILEYQYGRNPLVADQWPNGGDVPPSPIPESPARFFLTDLGPSADLTFRKLASNGWVATDKQLFRYGAPVALPADTSAVLSVNGKGQALIRVAAGDEASDLLWDSRTGQTTPFSPGGSGLGVSPQLLSENYAAGTTTWRYEYLFFGEGFSGSDTDGVIWNLSGEPVRKLGTAHVAWGFAEIYGVEIPHSAGDPAYALQINDQGDALTESAGSQQLNGQPLDFFATDLNNDRMLTGLKNGQGGWWQAGQWHTLAQEPIRPVALNNRGDILALAYEGDFTLPVATYLYLRTGPQPSDYRRISIDAAMPVGWSIDYVSAYFQNLPCAVNDDGVVALYAQRQILDSQGQPTSAPPEGRLVTLTPTGGLFVDANRDGEIKLDGSDATTQAQPFRIWVNDDNDSGDMGGDDIPGKTTDANYLDGVVNGTRDLVDFFPVYLDLKQLLTVIPPTSPGVKYKLKQADGAVNFVYTSLTRQRAQDYQTGFPVTGFSDALDKAPNVAITHQITASGVDLAQYCPNFLSGIRDSEWGVILIEGRAVTTAPLVLSVEQSDGTVLSQMQLPLRISSVESMFRHVDMTQVPKKYGGSAYTLPAPVPVTHTIDLGEAWPDSQTSGKYFVFVHGFNVDGQRARGWNSEVFKRLHVLGSKARFIGVTWHGATGIKLGGSYTDYHAAVYNAFQTGDALASALGFTSSADVTIAAHSLGNIVASQAIQSGGLVPTRYYMINCAAPIEAYDLPNVPDAQVHRMTESKWKVGAPGNRSTYAANWHQLFDATPADHRSELTWKGRFSGVLRMTHNFYSAGDDVVEDPQWDSPSILGLIFAQGFNFSRGAWVTQEFAKGANIAESIAVLNLSRVQGGWGESVFYAPPWSKSSLPPSTDQTREPYFGYFFERDLFDPAKASAAAGVNLLQYDILARGIPALSFAVAVHPLAPLENPNVPSLSRNFNMETEGRNQNVWPAEGHTADEKSVGRWLHSDFKNVALPYVHKMYVEMINRGSLK